MSTTIDGVTSSVHTPRQPTPQTRTPQDDEARSTKEAPGPTDALDLSEVAQERIEGSGLVPVRTELVERIRAEMEAGKYDVNDKLDAVVERLYELLSRA